MRVTGGQGDYQATVEVYRSGLERTRAGVQTVFLDVDGARVNTGIYGGPGVWTLSPLSGFLGRWGLRAGDERRLVELPAALRRGKRRVGGTADDTDVDFGEDVHAPNEGFTGTQDSLSTSAYALTRGRSILP